MKQLTSMPSSFSDLQKMSKTARTALWARYVPHSFAGQNKVLWYYIQCEQMDVRILPKHMVKLRKYRDKPADCMTRVCKTKYRLATGTTITKSFRGVAHRVMVCDDGMFEYNGQKFRTLSGVASSIAGIKISGPDFFGFSKRKKNAEN